MPFGGEPFDPRSVITYKVQMETGATAFPSRFEVGRKDNAFPIGMKIGRKVRRPVRGDLLLVRSIRIDDKYFKLPRFNQPLGQQILVLGHFGWITWMSRPIDDPGTVRRKECTTVISHVIRQPPDIGPVDIHRVEIEISIFDRRPHNRFSIRRDGCLRIIASRRGQPLHLLSIKSNGVDIVVIERPTIGAVPFRLRRTVTPNGVRRRIQHSPITWEKIPTRCSPLPGADETNRVTVQVQHIHLITSQTVVSGFMRGSPRVVRPIVGRLEDQFCPIE